MHLPAMHLHNVHLHNVHNAHLPAMHLHNVHMTNQETTVVAIFMKRTKIFLLYDFNLQ